MISEVTRTCATCPFARHLDGNRYVCSATHNHHNPVTRGHWQSTADCEQAIEEDDRGSGRTDTDADYVMQIEASLEKSETQATQQQQFSQVAAVTPYGIEVDSIKPDSYRIWSGTTQLGTMRRTSAGWLARTSDGEKSWHSTPNDAQDAVVNAMLAVAS